MAFRAALEEYRREFAPLDWAMTQANLGNNLFVLGERESATARLEEAVTAYQAALSTFMEAGHNHFASRARQDLEHALRLLDKRSGS